MFTPMKIEIETWGFSFGSNGRNRAADRPRRPGEAIPSLPWFARRPGAPDLPGSGHDRGRCPWL